MDDGLKTLFALYKGARWNEIKVSDEELSAAKKSGYLFDYPEFETHEAALSRRHTLLSRIDPQAIANAFLFSLSTRKLEYRSALGSYYYLKAVPEHDLMKSHNEILAAAAEHCYLCGWTAWETSPSLQDVKSGYNLYHWFRYRYGGNPVGILSLSYALFDLEQFLRLPAVVPTEEDRKILVELLSCLKQLNGSDKAGKLRNAITKAKVIRSNKVELNVLLGELGICGILAGKEHPSYDTYFADEYERDPVEYRNEFAYPLNRWHARDGIDTERAKEVFGDWFAV